MINQGNLAVLYISNSHLSITLSCICAQCITSYMDIRYVSYLLDNNIDSMYLSLTIKVVILKLNYKLFKLNNACLCNSKRPNK